MRIRKFQIHNVLVLGCWAALQTIHSTTAWMVPISASGLCRRNINQNGIRTLWSPNTNAVSAVQLFAAKKKNKKADDPNNPKNWFSDTEPFVAIRWFAKKGVLDADIKRALKARNISSLADLRKRSSCALPFMNEDDYADFMAALEKTYQRIRTTVEQELGGDASYDSTLLAEECFKAFALDAVSVIPNNRTKARDNLRGKGFSLVLGSSGSGKTIFALRGLPLLLFGESADRDEKNYFSVHFSVERAHKKMNATGQTFSEAVVSVVTTIITEKLEDKKFVDVKAIDLHLHVVLDEAGDELYSEFFDDGDKIQLLVDFVKRTLPISFTKRVHLTVVGTGLDKTTLTIPTDTVAVKFRMQFWTNENFEALLKQSDHPRKDSVRSMVRDYPVLQDLTTNGRCAYLLLDLMREDFTIPASRHVAQVLVRRIADRYARTNALSRLIGTVENFEVVRSVFRELDKSTSQPGVPSISQFDDMEDTTLRSIANSLVDIQVESSNGELVLVNDARFSLSISSAVAIVLINLLNTETDIHWDWHEFKSTVMLSELKRMIVRTQAIPRRFDRFVLRLLSSLPGTAAETTMFFVPLVGNCTVVLNQLNAGYADVVAPYRLVKAKYSVNDSSVVDLGIQKELDAMGLTDSPKHLLNQLLTNVFYRRMWESQEDAPETAVDKNVRSTIRQHRHECYPLDMLNGRRIVKEPAVVVGEVENDTDLFVTENGRRRAYSLTTFHKQRSVTAVFATNCVSIRLNANNQEAFVITPDDVNWQGKLLEGKELPVDFISGLRKHVELRFLFFGQH
jgi:hypothetical protein